LFPTALPFPARRQAPAAYCVSRIGAFAPTNAGIPWKLKSRLGAGFHLDAPNIY
jgi:hypothetical protein